ncbi:MAG: DUF1385 domain-containing protein [Defluviitaleaceae bacterium]|nr:DUF1385 domain-containing protein [Defluviitaleaceae bacterium]
MDKPDPIFYGGQALMEGVMMRGRTAYALAVRRPDNEIEITDRPITSTSNFLLKLPIIRGVVAFGSSMAVGYRSLAWSAEIAMQDEEPTTSKFEIFLQDKFGDKLFSVLMTISMVLSVVLALGLFMLLPTWIGTLIGGGALVGVVEGLVRITLFIAYIFLISRMKDIQRFFQYHGAEHMAINCHEQDLPLTTENVASCSRLHKRCGTSFMLVVMVISMIMFMIIRVDTLWMRFGSRILLLPVIAGLAYEVSVKWAGKRDNFLVRAIIVPGMALQRFTTAVPDEQQIEVAVTALKRALLQDQEGA